MSEWRPAGYGNELKRAARCFRPARAFATSKALISSCESVAEWAGGEFCRIAGLTPIGKADAPDFGHAKKKTSGPSVIQFFKGGSNISHYSENWLMIVVNIVLWDKIPLQKAIESTLGYFKGRSAIAWILPRGIRSGDVGEIAKNTILFEVKK